MPALPTGGLYLFVHKSPGKMGSALQQPHSIKPGVFPIATLLRQDRLDHMPVNVG